MGGHYYGLIEMSYVFGLVLVFACWELYSLKRDKKKNSSEEDSQPDNSPPARKED